jgi:DNA-binding MarR family transcriptional regulator
LAELVREHTSAVLRHAAATAKRMRLEASELAALEHVQAAGAMTQKHLGERLSMSPGAITTMIDRLESRGYVERTPNPEDRRSALVRITKAGLEESLRHLWPYIEDMKRIEEGFSEEERAIVARFLRAATRATHQAAERGR